MTLYNIMRSGEDIRRLRKDIRRLRKDMTQLQEEHKIKLNQLEYYERQCKHIYTETRYEPIIHEAHRTYGNPIEITGIDRRLPVYVPRKEVPRWYRKCVRCSKEEWTERTEEKIEKIPIF